MESHLAKRSPSLQAPRTPDVTLFDDVDDPLVRDLHHPYMNGHAAPELHASVSTRYDQEGDYPPNTTSSSSTAVQLMPLLANGSSPDQALGPTSAHMTRSSSSRLSAYSRTRTRLHPIALLPAVVLGFLFGNLNLFGTGSTVADGSAISSVYPDHALASDPIGANYTIHPNGHLYLHPSSLDPASVSSPFSGEDRTHLSARHGVRHPIEDLIANATRDWESKLARQSKTLKEAVAEYKRRYKRKPPKGFDLWFKFAQNNKVQLVDEFDTIHHDLEPFWALPPAVIKARAEELQKADYTSTFVFKNGVIEIIGAHKDDGRSAAQLGLMKRWAQWMSPVNISMSAHDGPSILMDTTADTRHRQAARGGYLLPQSQWEEIDEDAGLWGFDLACPETSRIRRYINGLETAALPQGPSYVADHFTTMNMCENPEWQYLHGFTAWPGQRPDLLKPIFSMSKTTMHNDILLTPLEQWDNVEPWDPEWEKKLYNKAVWRGSTTGVWFDRLTWWRSSQRMRMYWISQDQQGSRMVRFNGRSAETGGVESIVERNVSTSTLVKQYLDFGFSGKASQCTEDDGSCDAVRKLIKFMPGFGWNQANEYKYQIDLDGNGWSGRFHRLLSSNSAIIKSTIFPEWYQGWIQPWVHYIPIKVDYTDFFDIMAFFAGDLDGKNGHDELARQIGQNGKDYAANFWRYEDMETYYFRLALEWARCTADDRSSMDFDG